MKYKQRLANILSFLPLAACTLLFAACATSSNQTNVVELENKGTVMGIGTPDWLRLYLERGISALQAQYADKYCVIGEERGVNRQFVLSWADAASAQQRIGAILRTTIASRYEAVINAVSRSGTDSASQYRQEINNIVNTIVNVSYSGAQREADWWSLRRRYDPDNSEVFTDEYTAWVLYTIPKAEMNRQIALALESSVSRDSALYDVTIALARDILLQGYDENERHDAAAIRRTAASYYDPPGTVVAQALDEIDLIEEYAIGREVAAMILSNYRLWNGNPNLTDYVNKICSAIVINSPKPAAYNGYHTAVLDSDEVNAFASPGGHVFVTRGIVSAANSEDALAAAIAHEIAHIQLSHGIRAVRTSRDVEDWFRQFNASGAQIIKDRMNAGFSQVQEFDADIYAASLLASAGYSPRGLLDMLGELEKIQGVRRGGFNNTHPSPSSRIVNATVAVNRYANAPDTRSFRQRRFNAVSR